MLHVKQYFVVRYYLEFLLSIQCMVILKSVIHLTHNNGILTYYKNLKSTNVIEPVTKVLL